MADSQRQMVLLRHNLEVVRPLRFSKNRYLVRSKSVSGTEILNSKSLHLLASVKFWEAIAAICNQSSICFWQQSLSISHFYHQHHLVYRKALAVHSPQPSVRLIRAPHRSYLYLSRYTQY
jgi:hypothetical protein